MIDEVQYGELLREARPRVPETDEENERLVGILEALDGLPELSPEQASLAEMLTLLVMQYERRYELRAARRRWTR